MCQVMTAGDLPDDYETRGCNTPLEAWSDYHGRILELEIHCFAHDATEALQSGGAGTAT